MRGGGLALRSAHAGQESCVEECPCGAVGVRLGVPTQAGVMWRRGTQAGWSLCDQGYPCGVGVVWPGDAHGGAVAVGACAGLGSVSDRCPCGAVWHVSDRCPCGAEWHVSVGCPCGAEWHVSDRCPCGAEWHVSVGCPCGAGFQVRRTPRWGRAKGQREAHAGQSVCDRRCRCAAVITPWGCPCGATEAGQEGCSCGGSETGAS